MFKQEKTILILLSIIYAIIGYNTNQPTMQALGLMGWFGLVQLVYCIMSWLKRGNQFISPYVIFLLALYVFSFGQSFLWAFGLESERMLVGFYGITIAEVFNAQVLTLVMLAFFHIGASFWITQRSSLMSEQQFVDDNSPQLKTIGWILFIVSVVPYVTETVRDLIMSMTFGYGAIYGAGKVGFDNLSGFIADYFIPSIICLVIAYKDYKLRRTFFLGIIIINIVAILLIGGRSNAVILIAIVILLYNYLIKQFTKKWLIVGLVGVFLLLQVLSYIASVRTEGGRSANVEGLKVENNAAVDALAEMGGSMFCLIKTQDLVPEKYDYRYGKSYAFAFTTLIPNLGFWDIHPAKKESNLSDWLTDALGLGYGTGFSMCAEAYANFGNLGFIVFYFWGWFLASVFGKIDISVETRNYALLAFLLILFWFFLKLPRNNFINLVRPIFFVAGPIYLYCTKSKR